MYPQEKTNEGRVRMDKILCPYCGEGIGKNGYKQHLKLHRHRMDFKGFVLP
jgi:hypothetical protein